ncbi:kinase-like protein [Neolentinus lepideus HHB14362 ss-1]|uniref:Kinase-like protein n=1 Tax=Neolentinus lepideus HHB14362 ss-1 TaxID=1314782 RepID=A0A165TST4_9AGAM|nr:kinase-like protein [Neolentinus lepideus HHB14362 ss-1]
MLVRPQSGFCRHLHIVQEGPKRGARKAIDKAASLLRHLKKEDPEITPGLQVITNITTNIMKLSHNLHGNKHAAENLSQRLDGIQAILAKKLKWSRLSPEIEAAMSEFREVLKDIELHLHSWEDLSRSDAFFQHDSIASRIEDFHVRITNCIPGFQLTATASEMDWHAEFLQVSKEDKAEALNDILALLERVDELAQFLKTKPLDALLLEAAVSKVSTELPDHDPAHPRLSLSRLLKEASDVRPDFNIARKDVEFSRDLELDMGLDLSKDFMDKYSPREYSYCLGKYRGRTVLIKTITQNMVDESKVKKRVWQEAENWMKVWKQDRDCNAPMYGFWMDTLRPDEDQLHLVYPFDAFGSANVYVKTHPRADPITILRDAAKGLSVLHGMNIIHKDIRGCNIFVGANGNGMLAESGMSEIVEETYGGPSMAYTDTTPSRWHAPEMLMGHLDGGARACLQSDVWSLGITAYELLSYNIPYYEMDTIKDAADLGRRVVLGLRPTRPIDEKAIERGLDDDLWEFLEIECWKTKPEKRCDIHRVIEFFDSLILRRTPESDDQHPGNGEKTTPSDA